jgi:pimeloyl-ACP methyl ester carboxylesterase
MRAKHQQLSEAQARHLTVHGVLRNEDGSFSWKYDPYVRADPPVDMTQEQLHAMWARIECPTLLAYGRDSWASNPAEDGRAAHFRNAGRGCSTTPATGSTTTSSTPS